MKTAKMINQLTCRRLDDPYVGKCEFCEDNEVTNLTHGDDVLLMDVCPTCAMHLVQAEVVANANGLATPDEDECANGEGMEGRNLL